MIVALTNVFTGVFGWLATAMSTVLGILWDDASNSLTILGILAVCGLAISLFLLIFNIIQNFFHFRG